MNRSTIFTLVLCGIAIVAAAWGLSAWQQHTERTEPQQHNPYIEKWRGEISAHGTEAAYRAYVCEFEGAPEAEGHTAGHYFGAALYQEKGLAGVNACGEEFQYACLHEFFGRAVQDVGLSVVQELDAECRETHGDENSLCHHGIGHGILAYVGYSQTDLQSAVELCKTETASPYYAGQCMSGVFMEHFMQTMLGTDADVYPVTANAPYAPCDFLEGEEQKLCAVELPRAWRRAWWADSPTSTPAITQIGSLCTNIEPVLQASCFTGIGNDLFNRTSGNVEVARALCEQYSEDSEHRSACRAQVEQLARITEANRETTLLCSNE